MGVKEAIETLDEFCKRQEYECYECPIGRQADEDWIHWGCPIGTLIDDTTIKRALGRLTNDSNT